MSLFGIRASMLSEDVRIALDEMLKCQGDPLVLQDKLNHLSTEQVFDYYLVWHGILGRTKSILQAFDSIRRAERPHPIQMCPACYETELPCACDRCREQTQAVAEAVNNATT